MLYFRDYNAIKTYCKKKYITFTKYKRVKLIKSNFSSYGYQMQ